MHHVKCADESAKLRFSESAERKKAALQSKSTSDSKDDKVLS